MPDTKYFIERIEILDQILGGIRRYEREQLLERLNESLVTAGMKPISARTLHNDLKYLKEDKGAPLHTPRGPDNRYYYTRPFSLWNMPLDETEVDHLRQAVDILKKAMPHMLGTEMENLVSKMENRLDTNVEGKGDIIQFERHTQASGSHWIKQLFTAIRLKAALRVSYQPYQAPEPVEKVFFPYLLKEYRSRWFVFGKYQGEKRVVNLAIDRVKQIRNSAAEYEKNDVIDSDRFFQNLIGVSLPYDGQVEQVVIRVRSSLAPYIRSKPIHRLQEVEHTYANGDIRVSIPLYVNYELRSTLLGFGKDVEVLKPVKLRRELKEILQEAAGRYGDK